MEEVANFEQSDLLDDDVMMLDVGVSVREKGGVCMRGSACLGCLYLTA